MENSIRRKIVSKICPDKATSSYRRRCPEYEKEAVVRLRSVDLSPIFGHAHAACWMTHIQNVDCVGEKNRSVHAAERVCVKVRDFATGALSVVINDAKKILTTDELKQLVTGRRREKSAPVPSTVFRNSVRILGRQQAGFRKVGDAIPIQKVESGVGAKAR